MRGAQTWVLVAGLVALVLVGSLGMPLASPYLRQGRNTIRFVDLRMAACFRVACEGRGVRMLARAGLQTRRGARAPAHSVVVCRIDDRKVVHRHVRRLLGCVERLVHGTTHTVRAAPGLAGRAARGGQATEVMLDIPVPGRCCRTG